MKKKFIEYDLPLAVISEESAREKNIRHGHPSTLHIWWARRPLASSRATAFAALIDDPGPENPEKRAEIMKLIEEITPWEAVKNGNSDAIRRAQAMIAEQYGGTPPKALDPFAGGGSIPLEALRLGCETYASDYNPVAVFIEKATLEWPRKYGIEVELPRSFVEGKLEESQTTLDDGADTVKVNPLAFMVERWANRILEEARAEIGRFYPTESAEGLVGKRGIKHQDGWIPVGYLWARTIPCQNPTCGAEIPLIGQFWLSKKKGKKIAYRPVVDEDARRVDFELLAGGDLERAMEDGFDPSDGTISGAKAQCPVCQQVVKGAQLRVLGKQGQIGKRMVAVVLTHGSTIGKTYRLATENDRCSHEQSVRVLEEKLSDWTSLDDPIPKEAINPKRPSPNARGLSSVTRYGFTHFADLYSERQRLCLITLVQKLGEKRAAIERDAGRFADVLPQRGGTAEQLTQAVYGSIAIVVSRMADRLTMFSRWDNSRETLVAALGSDKKLPMIWDFAEANPFSGVGGGWQSQLAWVTRYIETNSWPAGAGISVTRDSATLLPIPDESLDVVLTDPPYYDNYPYADLSDYFYVWLKRMLAEQHPELFTTPLAPKTEEAVMLTSRNPDLDSAKEFFENQLSHAFSEMHRVLKPGGTAVVVYAHTTTEGWETMLKALVNAGFVVTGSWPIHTEMKNKLQSARAAFLASSIYMVCRKAEREALGFWNDIQPRVKARVEEKLEQFWNSGLVKGGDFFISAIGPGMEAFSRYERVETYDGKPVGVRDLLQYIRTVATDFLVHRLLKNAATGAIDKESQFYLTYRWTYQDNPVPFDDANKIARAEGVTLEKLWDENGFVKKSGAKVSVLGPKDRKHVEYPAHMVDAMHLACRLWEKGKKEELTRMLAHSGYGASSAFWQFCQAVAECLVSGTKEKQLLEGMILGKEQHQRAGSAAAAERGAQESLALE